jgi:hypothetical protein
MEITMTDIVERLRQVQGDNEDAREAADEIERLRAIIYKNCDPLTATPEEIVAALAAAVPKP